MSKSHRPCASNTPGTWIAEATAVMVAAQSARNKSGRCAMVRRGECSVVRAAMLFMRAAIVTGAVLPGR